jgi:hypothetical protein
MSGFKDLLNEKQMGNSEFTQKVKDVVMNPPQNGNYLSFTTPLTSGYGDYSTNIAVSVATSLGEDGFYARGIERTDEDNNRFVLQYYSKEGIEIYNIIREDFFMSSTYVTYVFNGEINKIKFYYDSIYEIIDTIIDESQNEY